MAEVSPQRRESIAEASLGLQVDKWTLSLALIVERTKSGGAL